MLFIESWQHLPRLGILVFLQLLQGDKEGRRTFGHANEVAGCCSWQKELVHITLLAFVVISRVFLAKKCAKYI